MPGSGFALGVDFGTSNTVAVLRWPDGRARSLLVDGSPLLPSAVYADPGGNLLVGKDAIHSARLDPARFEPNPKRRIDDHSVLLGDRELPVVELVAAVLIRIAEEARRTTGGAPIDPVTLTCPAGWVRPGAAGCARPPRWPGGRGYGWSRSRSRRPRTSPACSGARSRSGPWSWYTTSGPVPSTSPWWPAPATGSTCSPSTGATTSAAWTSTRPSSRTSVGSSEPPPNG